MGCPFGGSSWGGVPLLLLSMLIILEVSYSFYINPFGVCQRRHYRRFLQSNDSNDLCDDDDKVISYNDFEEQDLSSTPSWFDDFGGVPIGETEDAIDALPQRSTLPEQPALTARIAAVQREEQRRDAIGDRNWKMGNWQVRGFSLETNSDASVSVIATAPDASEEHRIDLWVGRTDGSLFGIQLGTNYWTRLNLDTTSADPSDFALPDDPVDEDEDFEREEIVLSTTDAKDDPFQIVAQFQVGSSALSAIAVLPMGLNSDDDDTEEHCYIFTGTQGTLDIKRLYWDASSNEVSLNTTMTGVHSGTSILAMKLIPKRNGAINAVSLLLSVDDTSIVIWEALSGRPFGRVDSVRLPMDEGLTPSTSESHTIECVDTDGSHIFIGTSLGYVMVYSIDDIQQARGTVSAIGYWRATTDGCSVTAIQCGGFGTLGRNTPSAKSLALFTGDTNGVVKRWEVLQISSQDGSTYKMEAWPKLSTQRLAKRAHIFMGHQGTITTLLSVDGVKFVSASADGTVRAWNTATGKEMFRMEGFPDPIRSLCLLDSGTTDGTMDIVPNTILVTNGMNKYVCVHDFSADDEDEADYDLDMPEYSNQ